MTLSLNSPEAIFAGLALLDVSATKWVLQIDGSKFVSGTVTDYTHSSKEEILTTGRVTHTFTIDHAGTKATVAGTWDLNSDTQEVTRDGKAQDLKPGNGHPFIDPGFDGLSGSHVWLRYGLKAGEPGEPVLTREFRFAAPIDVNTVVGLLRDAALI